MHSLAVLFTGVLTGQSLGEDWGLYAITPASAPALVLEAVGSGTTDGTVVSIGKPVAAANQKWVIASKGDNFYSLKPAYSSTLVLAAAKGGVNNGAAIVLETDQGQAWQEWAITKNENATYSLLPRHSPERVDRKSSRA